MSQRYKCKYFNNVNLIVFHRTIDRLFVSWSRLPEFHCYPSNNSLKAKVDWHRSRRNRAIFSRPYGAQSKPFIYAARCTRHLETMFLPSGFAQVRTRCNVSLFSSCLKSVSMNFWSNIWLSIDAPHSCIRPILDHSKLLMFVSYRKSKESGSY